ncbi:MAG: Rieske 2Fe-2S domain-containing protein [Chloroflexi bacterium]|nr:Rieske 2Fe-2S domain-containing protein [Chloroflexota bacterium]
MADFITVAKLKDLKPGTIKLVEAGGKRIGVANVSGTICAFDIECTHKGGPLEKGTLEGEILTCPWHKGKFNVKTGQAISPPPKMPIATYAAKIEGEEVKIAL